MPVICPPDDKMPDLEEALLHEIELSIRAMPALVRRGLSVGLIAYDLLALPFRFRLARYLDGEDARSYFLTWSRGLGKDFAKGIRALIAMAYYELPEVCDGIDYTPDAWLAKVLEERYRRYPDEIEAHERSIFERDPLPLPSEALATAAETDEETPA